MTYVYYNFEQTNTTTEKQVVGVTDIRKEPLLQTPDDWNVSLVKMNLPSSAIPAFRNIDSSHYQVKIGLPICWNLINTPSILYDIHASSHLPLSSEYSYDTYQDTIEAINRTFLKCYRNMLDSFVQESLKITVANTFSFSKAIGSSTPSHTENFTFSPTANTCSGKLGYIRIKKLKVGFIGTESEVANNNSVHPHSLFLVAPDGTEALIYANRTTTYANEMRFCDEFYKSTASNASDITQAIPAGEYHPIESFVKFSNNVDLSGTWSWRFDNKDSGYPTYHEFHLNVDYEIEFYTPPIYAAGQDVQAAYIPPILDHNKTSNLLEFVLQERVFTSNMYIEVSPRLNELLGFPSVLSSDGLWCRIKLPQIASLSDSLDQSLRFAQPVDTSYRLNNIRTIQLRSNTIPCIGEFDSVDSSKIIMSFDKPAGFIADSFEFSSNNSLRTYDLNGQNELSQINLSVWVKYEDGEILQAQLSPYSTFSALLKFENNKV